jgi:hypothetical protein
LSHPSSTVVVSILKVVGSSGSFYFCFFLFSSASFFFLSASSLCFFFTLGPSVSASFYSLTSFKFGTGVDPEVPQSSSASRPDETIS